MRKPQMDRCVSDVAASFRKAIWMTCVAVLIGQGTLQAHDWPQWRGPRRDAISAETGLLSHWPEGGPRLAWHAEGLGTGYASLVVSRGKLFTLGRHDANVVVTALEAASGKPVWTKTIGTSTRIPSSTPTCDQERLYALDPDGELVCLDVRTGDVIWEISFEKDFSGVMMSGRGYGESPLIDGDKLICTPGGPKAAMVALDKFTGKVLWKSELPELGSAGRDGAGFASAVVTDAAGVRQYVQLMGRGLVSFAADDGRFLWGYNAIANGTANIPTPVVYDDFVFAANGYAAGSVHLKLLPDLQPGMPPGVKPKILHELSASKFQNHHGGVIRIGEYLYGGHGNNNGLPTCLELASGKILWKRRGPGVGSAAVIYADGHLYFRYQNGVIALIEAAEKGYELKGTFEVPGAGGDSWAHPVISDGKLYLREQDHLWVYELRAGQQSIETVSPAEPDATAPPQQVALRKLGATVESLRLEAIGESLPTGPKMRSRRLFEFALDREAELANANACLIVTLRDQHLTTEGLLRTDVTDALNDLEEPFLLNMAGTDITDTGLQQLGQFDPLGLNLELCGRVTDDGLRHLKGLPTLRVLILAGTGVTEKGLAHLAGNNSLRALDLELCDGITDAACDSIGTMTWLQALVFKKSGFERNRISAAGLEQLRGLTDLRVLDLYGNNLKNEGLVHLQPLTRLQELNLSLLAINDDGLPHLRTMKNLRRLELLYSEGFAGPMLTSKGMEFLAPFTELRQLNLTGAKLTDSALPALMMLKNLQHLQLVRTRVTSDGLETLEKAFPECKITR